MRKLINLLATAVILNIGTSSVISCKEYIYGTPIKDVINQDVFNSFKINLFNIKSDILKKVELQIKNKAKSFINQLDKDVFSISFFSDDSKTPLTLNALIPNKNIYFMCNSKPNQHYYSGKTDLIFIKIVFDDNKFDLSNIIQKDFLNKPININDQGQGLTINNEKIIKNIYQNLEGKYNKIRTNKSLIISLYKDQNLTPFLFPDKFKDYNFSLYFRVSESLNSKWYKKTSQLINANFLIINSYDLSQIKINENESISDLYINDFITKTVSGAYQIIFQFLKNNFTYVFENLNKDDLIINFYSDKNKKPLEDNDVNYNKIIYFQIFSNSYRVSNHTQLLWFHILYNKDQKHVDKISEIWFNNKNYEKLKLQSEGIKNLQNFILKCTEYNNHFEDLNINLYKSETIIKLSDQDLINIYNSDSKIFNFNLQIVSKFNSIYYFGKTEILKIKLILV